MKKFMKYGAVIVAAMVFAGTAHAMTVTWSAAATSFLTTEGVPVGIPQGSLLKLGILSTSEFNMQANQFSAAFLDSHFNTFATGHIGDGTGIDGSFTEASIGPGLNFFGRQLYILAYNAPSFGAATAAGLYTNPNWIAPAADNLALSFDLSDPGLHIVIGSFSAGSIAFPSEIAGMDAVSLNGVFLTPPPPFPEPSSFALAGLGLLGLLGVIRRRSQTR